MIPWIIFAVIAVPLAVLAYFTVRRNTASGEGSATEDTETQAEIEREFADAEAYEAKWHDEDKTKYQQERLP
jgi:hypothetical protein